MTRDRETSSFGETKVKLPDAGVILEAQRAAAENASRVANAAWHYALSINRAWIDLWDSRLPDYLELPKRFALVQTDFFEQAFDHYQESVQKLGGIAKQAASKIKEETESAIRDTQAAGDRAAHQFQSETKDGGSWGERPMENPLHNAGEERREPEQPHSPH